MPGTVSWSLPPYARSNAWWPRTRPRGQGNIAAVRRKAWSGSGLRKKRPLFRKDLGILTDLSTLLLPDRGQPATDLHLVDAKGFDAWLKAQPDRARSAASAQGFRGEGFQ